MTNYEIKKNEQFNSNEVYFDEVPSKEVRDNLKGLRMRWNPKKSCWYGFADSNAIANAIDGKKKATVVKTEKRNYLDIKVGDIFFMSWGYDQTNVNFFQVIELVGEKMVRIREVHLPEGNESWTGFMARNVSFKVTNEILPATDYSVHIKDNEKGDLKKVLGTKTSPYLNMTSYANAYPYDGRELYESWYA